MMAPVLSQSLSPSQHIRSLASQHRQDRWRRLGLAPQLTLHRGKGEGETEGESVRERKETEFPVLGLRTDMRLLGDRPGRSAVQPPVLSCWPPRRDGGRIDTQAVSSLQ